MDEEFDENAEADGDMGSPEHDEPEEDEAEGEGEGEGAGTGEGNDDTTEFLDAAEAASFKHNKLAVAPEDRITRPMMTRYERARIIGTRALQISMCAPVLVDIGQETDPLVIAMMEMREKKIPMIVRRYMPDGSYEDWKVDELEIEGQLSVLGSCGPYLDKPGHRIQN